LFEAWLKKEVEGVDGLDEDCCSLLLAINVEVDSSSAFLLLSNCLLGGMMIIVECEEYR
jgi:hypothetical protein